MRQALFTWTAAALTVLAGATLTHAQPKVEKGVEATLKIPRALLTQDRSWGGRYYRVSVEMTDQGPVVGSRPDWLSVVPQALEAHRVIKISGWEKPREKKGERYPGYTEVSLLREPDREIIRLRFLDIHEGPELDRAFWEVAFHGTLSPEQAQAYIEQVRADAGARVTAAPGASGQSRQVKSRFFATSDGVRLHYLDAGEGPLVILIPGWTLPAGIWDAQMAALSPYFRVIALDPRSQGQSEGSGEGLYPERRAQDIHELVQHLEAPSAALVGWSLAVQELLAYVDAYGTESLSGLVLVDGSVATTGDRIQTTDRRILSEIQRDRRNLTERFVRGLFKTPQDEARIRQLLDASLRTPTSSAFALLGEYLVMDRNLADALGKVACPLLFAVTPGLKTEADEAAARVPGARVEVFEGAGHALFVDQPERFNSLLQGFLTPPR